MFYYQNLKTKINNKSGGGKLYHDEKCFIMKQRNGHTKKVKNDVETVNHEVKKVSGC